MSAQPSDGGTVDLVPVGGTYISGAPVTLTAVAAPGFSFDRWEGDASGSDAITTITMDRDKAVVAHFNRLFP